MAIGFPPEYSEDYAAHHLKTAQKIALVHLALEKKSWEISRLGTQRIIASISYSVEDKLATEPVTLKVHNITITLNEHNITIKSQSAQEVNNDNGKNRKEVYALMEQLNHLKDEYSNEELVAHYNSIKHQVIEDELPQVAYQEPEPPRTSKEKMDDFIAMFKPTEGYWATPIIMWLNILLFIIMVASGVHFFSPNTTDLINWGANYAPVTLDGQPWRLFTSTFLHIGILHLLMNMYALVYIGALLEQIIGTKRFVVAYLLSGIVASAASLYWHDTVVSAGASGAIFGMYGLFLALLSANIIAKEARKPLLTSIGVFVLFNLANGMKDGIDNAAHIGGLISGAVIGYIYIVSLKAPENKQKMTATLVVPALIAIAVSFFILQNKSNDVGAYLDIREEMYYLDKAAVDAVNLPQGASDDDYVKGIQTAMKNWEKIGRIIVAADSLDLPDNMRKDALQLKEYSRLRVATCLAQQKYIANPTPTYLQEIETLASQTDSIMQQMAD